MKEFIVLILEDNQILATDIKAYIDKRGPKFIDKDFSIKQVLTFQAAADLLEALDKEKNRNILILLDGELGERLPAGFSYVKPILDIYPSIKIISISSEDNLSQMALQEGAHGEYKKSKITESGFWELVNQLIKDFK
jgi:CheY-like chemotaxis protein